MTPPDANERRVIRAAVARRRAIRTLIVLVGAAIVVWGLGVMLFPLFGDRVFYLMLLSLLGIGVWALIVGLRFVSGRPSPDAVGGQVEARGSKDV